MSASDPTFPLHTAQRWVRPGVDADAPAIDAWLQARAPLPVPEARARRLSLDALLAQGGQGICLLAGTNAVPDALHCLMPVSLVHHLGTGGRVAMVAEWWPPAGEAPVEGDNAADLLPGWLAACCAELADWCRAHGIRHIALAPGLVAGLVPGQRPEGFVSDASGLWLRILVPTPKRLG